MGLFFNYNKPGPGIDKNAPEKKGALRFFDILMRKLWKLIKANALTFILSLPFIFIMYVIAPVSDNFILKLLGEADESTLALWEFTLRTLFAVCAYNFLGAGPASAGYAYITRCFTRQEHAWILSDFKDKFKENFKQSIILSLVDIVFTFAFITAIYFYYTMYANTSSNVWLFLCCIMLVVSILFLFMNYHAYQMMVTFSSTTLQLFKNSLIFALVELPMNIFLTALGLGINIAVFLLFNPLFAILLSIFITPLFVRFPIEYSSARAISKKILSNMTTPKNESEE